MPDFRFHPRGYTRRDAASVPRLWLRPARLLFSILVLFGAAMPASGQHKMQVTAQLAAPAPEHICVLHHNPENAFTFTPPVVPASASKTQAATFTVDYATNEAGDAAWPQAAIDAFDYAVGIWTATLTSGVTIQVEAHFTDRGGCDTSSGIVLGSAGPRLLWGLTVGGTTSFYADALADKLLGYDIAANQGNPGPDIIARFNKDCDEFINTNPGDDHVWYYGTDGNVPGNRVDFVSVVLHELGHGLGYSGSGRVDDGNAGNGTECDGVNGNGCRWSPTPIIYDRSVETRNDDTGLNVVDDFTTPSAALGTALLGGTHDGLFFNGTSATANFGGQAPPLYAPNPFQQGSSYSHLDEATFPAGNDHALMTPSLSFGEAAHKIGGVSCGLFEDLGWTIAVTNCNTLLPVELVFFEVLADGSSIRLIWETASELNNAGFEIQHQAALGDDNDARWHRLDWADGHGTTDAPQRYSYRLDDAAPGPHRFRLKQIDYDGAFEYSPEVETFVAVSGAYALSETFPNPAQAEAHVTLVVAAAQQARLAVYDLRGRRVALLHDGPLTADVRHGFTLQRGTLPPGLYLLRAEGEHFTDTRAVTFIR